MLEEKLQELKQLVGKLRIVKYGDYVYSEDHNLIVDSLHRTHEILEIIKAEYTKGYAIDKKVAETLIIKPKLPDVTYTQSEKYAVELSVEGAPFETIKSLTTYGEYASDEPNPNLEFVISREFDIEEYTTGKDILEDGVQIIDLVDSEKYAVIEPLTICGKYCVIVAGTWSIDIKQETVTKIKYTC